MINSLIKYNGGEIELIVLLENETLWFSQTYKEKELDEVSTTENFSVICQEVKRSLHPK